MVEPESSTLQAYDLTTEHRTDPIGIDETAPILAWRLAGSGRDRSTSAYRIRVVVDGDPRDESEPGELAGPDPDRVVWDSGVVEDPNVVQIPYGGGALQPRTRYRWAVRVIDESGRESEWSEPASFETAPGAADWEAARWIGAAAAAEPAVIFPRRIGAVDLDTYAGHHNIERIGLPGGDSRPVVGASFRRSFAIPRAGGVSGVRLLADGGPATSVRAVARDADGGEVELPCDGSEAGLGSGDYTLVVEVSPEAGSAGPAPALSARLEIAVDGADPIALGTDGTWEVAEAGSESYALAWSYGLHGAPPWGRSPATYRPSPLLRRDFELSAPIRRARLHISALGLYEARINGEPVGDDHLAPGWTEYASRMPFRSYDVTHLLEPGANTIGAVLADGWYAGSLCWLGRFTYGDRRALRALLDIELADGTRTTVTTDGSWSTGEGEIRYADLQNGTVIDRRLEPDGWDAPGFPAQQWLPAEPIEVDPSRVGPLEAAVAPPIRVLHEVPARSVERRDDGRQIVDFGENIVGWVRLSLRGKDFEPGHRIILRHAEVLDHNGELYLEALRSARATDEFFLRGKDSGGDPGDETEVLEPRFTVHGFRFAEITGVPDDLDPADLTARVVHADMAPIGEFSCSDERLNRLQENIVRGQRGNFLAVPTDCPQRDERLGWTGDAQVFAPTAAYNYDVRAFLRSWLRALRDGQQDNGAVPHVAPDVLSVLGREGGAAGWGDAIVLVPYALYQAYGDLRPTAEAYDGIAHWLDFLTEHSEGHVRPDEGFNDWLAITPTPKALVSTAFFAYAASVAAKLAETLGRDSDATRWRELFSLVRKAFRANFVRGGGVVVSGTQAAYVLALHIGLLEPDEIPRAADRLVDEIAARNWHLTTGFLGTPYLLDVLTDNGRIDAAYRLLMQESCPSWLYPVVHGDATTIWERWDSWSDARGFQDPGMTSFNHYAYGAVGDWIYRTVGGLAPGAPGYRRIVVRPRPGGGITRARAALDTPYGRASTSWRLQGKAFRLELDVPVGATADVWLPGEAEPRTVGSGSYAFDATLEAATDTA